MRPTYPSNLHTTQLAPLMSSEFTLCLTFAPGSRSLLTPQYRGRFALAIDPANPTQYVKTNTPVLNQDLDPLLEVPCTSNPTGRCATLKDTLIVLPGSYTRIAFNTPAQTGLYVWHW